MTANAHHPLKHWVQVDCVAADEYKTQCTLPVTLSQRKQRSAHLLHKFSFLRRGTFAKVFGTEEVRRPKRVYLSCLHAAVYNSMSCSASSVPVALFFQSNKYFGKGSSPCSIFNMSRKKSSSTAHIFRGDSITMGLLLPLPTATFVSLF